MGIPATEIDIGANHVSDMLFNHDLLRQHHSWRGVVLHFLSDVMEMLLLLSAAISFAIMLLKEESRTNNK